MFGFLKRILFGGLDTSDRPKTTKEIEHCMKLIFQPSISLDRLHEIEDQLIELVEEQGVGEVDGHDVAVDGSDCTIYTYGLDAKSLYAAAQCLPRERADLQRCIVQLRFGDVDDENAPEMRFKFGDDPSWPQ